MKEKNKEIATFKIAQELGGLELLDAKYEKQNFSRHSHEGYTIGVIEKEHSSSFEQAEIISRHRTASSL